MMTMMIKYFAFFKPWTCPDGTHINEEQNQNHEMSTGYRPKPGTSQAHAWFGLV